MKMSIVDKLSWILIVIGGLNWGLVGAFKYNVIDKIFGVQSTGSRVVYVIVGVATLVAIYKMIMMMSKPDKTA